VLFRRPDFTEHWLLDPLSFFHAALGRRTFPAPDPTTCAGVRAFFTHIDGDGFRHKSSAKPGKLSSEVILENVIKRYPFPYTCSVIEAEVRAWGADQQPEDEQSLAGIARTLFALPQVEPASHTFSHPFFWDETDKTASTYDTAHLILKPEFQFERLDVAREVTGSVKYIQEQLLPPGKKVEVFLWTGNCRPGAEALRLARELGLENLNGGDTLISRKHPSITRVAPGSISWGDELQIYTAAQNENVFRLPGLVGVQRDAPFLGGFMHAQETFEMTETPRRLKPVNIYYHWYSGDDAGSLRALTRLYDWAMGKELHAQFASDYVRQVRDAKVTRLFRRSDRHWVLVNGGQSRTFRLPAGGLTPDLHASRGVLGYRTVGDQMYMHTDGAKRVDLVLAEAPRPHLHLVASTGRIEFLRLEARQAKFSVRDFRPCQVILGGLAAGAQVAAVANGEPARWAADAQGQVKLQFPAEATVELESR
jgi:hypothetical protein